MQKGAPESEPYQRKERRNTYRFQQKFIEAVESVLKCNATGQLEFTISEIITFVRKEKREEWPGVGESYKYTIIIKGEDFSDEWSITDELRDFDFKYPNLPSTSYNLKRMLGHIIYEANCQYIKQESEKGFRGKIMKIMRKLALV